MTREQFKPIYKRMTDYWRLEPKEEHFNEYYFALQKYEPNWLNLVISDIIEVSEFFPKVPVINKVSADKRMMQIRNQDKAKEKRLASKKEIESHRIGAANFCKHLLELDSKGKIIKCNFKDQRTISIGEAIVSWVENLAKSTTDLSRPKEEI